MPEICRRCVDGGAVRMPFFVCANLHRLGSFFAPTGSSFFRSWLAVTYRGPISSPQSRSPSRYNTKNFILLNLHPLSLEAPISLSGSSVGKVFPTENYQSRYPCYFHCRCRDPKAECCRSHHSNKIPIRCICYWTLHFFLKIFCSDIHVSRKEPFPQRICSLLFHPSPQSQHVQSRWRCAYYLIRPHLGITIKLNYNHLFPRRHIPRDDQLFYEYGWPLSLKNDHALCTNATAMWTFRMIYSSSSAHTESLKPHQIRRTRDLARPGVLGPMMV